MLSWFGLPRAAGHAALISALAIVGQPVVADFDGSVYPRNVSLSADVDIFWSIDTSAETIRVAVHAKAASGWASVGISEMGGMEGADIVFYETATGKVTDAHSLVATTPVIDECTQDWTLLSAEAVDGSLVFEVERALDTGDAQDRAFTDDTAPGAQSTRLIAAWGESESMSYHGTNSAKGEVIMFGGAENADAEPLADVVSNPEVSFFDVSPKNFPIPTQRTWYEETCVPASELPALDQFHVIGFQGVIQDDTSEYVHHLVLKGYTGFPDCGLSCEEWFNSNIPSESSSSTDDYFSSYSYSGYFEYFEANNITIPDFCLGEVYDIFPWAPGVSDFQLPPDVGFSFGNASGGFMSVMVQTHYNNPNGDAGKLDSSGVRVYYTEELRPMEMGYRNDSGGNEELIHSTEVEYYSFVQAGGFVVPASENVTIQKGDRFETECFYDTALSSVGSNNVTFGPGSENEMCIDFVFYYPAQRVPFGACGLGVCAGSVGDHALLGAEDDFDRTFGIVDTCTTDTDDAADNAEEGDSSSTSSARTRVAWLGLVAISTTSALVVGSIGRAFGIHLD
eukprot:g13759.t1